MERKQTPVSKPIQLGRLEGNSNPVSSDDQTKYVSGSGVSESIQDLQSRMHGNTGRTSDLTHEETLTHESPDAAIEVEIELKKLHQRRYEKK
ncbi:hypothetical protein GOV12_00485 [Candidatus Pacearchaeota archaeon]|nr:hypothetical protein [Candidatus Pacearchaeota archaeon]